MADSLCAGDLADLKVTCTNLDDIDLSNLETTCSNLDSIDFPCNHDTECKSCSEKNLNVNYNNLLSQLVAAMNIVRQNKFEFQPNIIIYETSLIKAIASPEKLVNLTPTLNEYLKSVANLLKVNDREGIDEFEINWKIGKKYPICDMVKNEFTIKTINKSKWSPEIIFDVSLDQTDMSNMAKDFIRHVNDKERYLQEFETGSDIVIENRHVIFEVYNNNENSRCVISLPIDRYGHMLIKEFSKLLA